MVKLKRILSSLIIFAVIFAFGLNCDRISEEISNYINKTPELVINPDNGYKKEYEYMYIKDSDDFIPESKEDLLEIFYSVLNNGWKEFTFYCPADYVDCLNDIRVISQDEVLLANLNNFVSSYNSYSTLKTVFDTAGEVTIKVEYNYSDLEIEMIDGMINKIFTNNINDNMTDEEKIKVLHDYIVNNSKYDKERADNNTSEYDSARMNGLLFDGYGICTAYADVMEVFLTKLNIPNYKISSSNHVWNAVYINGKWVHLDATWDDPTTSDGSDMLSHDFFLVDNSVIVKDDKEELKEHSFDLLVYQEFDETKKAQ